MHAVEWRGVFRVIDDDTGAVLAVCETLEEAENYIGNGAASVELNPQPQAYNARALPD